MEYSLYSLNSFNGMKIQVNDIVMSKTIEDWTKVRSPSRAARRRKRGFKQNIIYKIVPKEEGIFLKEQNTLIVHSEIYKKLKEKNKTNDN